MLKYLVISTGELLQMMVILGFIHAYRKAAFGDRYVRVLLAGDIAGVVLALVMTLLKSFTGLISTGLWNLRIYAVIGITFVLFIIFASLKNKKQLFGLLASVMLAVLSAAFMVDFLPAFMETPYTVLQTEETILSTSYLLKMIGCIFGFVLCLVLSLSVYRCSVAFSDKAVFGFTVAAVAVTALQLLASSFSIMIAKRIIASNHTLFLISKAASNNSYDFIYASLVIAAILPIVLLIRSFNVNEPYSNSAEHRKILAKWRRFRRQITTVLVCSVFSVIVMTAINEYANRVAELSPIEDAEVVDGAFYIPFEQVNDGHLHRFGYTTDNGITVRFIVIKKPNSSSFGVGLDACDICGETGYYEKDDQVVCNRCDVVMNINTIGFKGGCNPKIISYEINDGCIIVPVDDLIAHESDFK